MGEIIPEATSQQSSPEIEKEELVPVSKIHFLVHPGYLSKLGVKFFGRTPKDWQKILFESYLADAESMAEKKDEIMVAILPIVKKYRKGNIEKLLREEDSYMQDIGEVSKKLGRRFIAISDFDLTSDKPDASVGEVIGSIAKARGFSIDKKIVDSEGGGEVWGLCVQDVLSKLKSILGLKKVPQIKERLTDKPHRII